MGWFYRRTAKFGPFRLNFSKSGIGVSAGVRGARVSTGPRGTYVNLGTHGVYYRQNVGGGNRATSSTQWRGNSINPIHSLPADLNYPAFPKHGLPRIVTTLGILGIPIFIIGWLVLMSVIASNSNSSAPSETKPAGVQVVKSNRERGFQAGFEYARQTQDTSKTKKLDERRLKQLATEMAMSATEDQNWQSGWIEGYKEALKASSTPQKSTVKSLSTPRTLASQPTPTIVQPIQRSSDNGYIRGPRGGCYYISGSGAKVYVDRALCN